MQVPATIFDVTAAALCQNQPLPAVFKDNYAVGLLPVDGSERIVRAALKIRKPCPYLQQKRCTIYGVRPLACILFPESHIAAGAIHDILRQEHYRDYLCLRLGLVISPAREQVVRKLRRLLQNELVVSDCFLFGCSPLLLDLADFGAVFDGQPAQAGEQAAGAQADALHALSIERLDDLFWQIFGGLAPFAEIERNVARLDHPTIRQSLLQYLRSHRAMKRLARKHVDTERVFRLVDGTLRARKTSLLPGECRFL